MTCNTSASTPQPAMGDWSHHNGWETTWTGATRSWRVFDRHAEDPATARLMKTPLQVLIITIILERLGSLPPDRYQLFWRYYETIYDRELAKNTTLRTLLMQQRNPITSLHESVGLTLQALAETSTDARALLPTQQLRQLTEQRLMDIGHEPGTELSKLASTIVTAATHRLVLLVPGEDNTVTFEIRSLQELMAARALTSGTDEQVRRTLSVTATSPALAQHLGVLRWPHVLRRARPPPRPDH
jgi:hypothetical protein